MRVLIIRNAMPYDFGGAERFAVDLASELKQFDWEPLVVSRSAKLLSYAQQQSVSHKKGWWWHQQNWSGKRALLFPIYIGWQVLLFMWYLQLIARWRPQVVHPQSKDDFIAATWAAKLLGKRVIWTDHADLKYIYANQPVRFKNPVGKWVYRSSKHADKITLVSQSERQLIATALGFEPDGHYTVIYNGVREHSVVPKPREVGAFIFCATSRLVTAKGISEQITAFGKFVASHPEAEMWFVGDGPEEATFKKQADGIPGIHFMGHSDAPDEYVAAADVFVHPSYHEGFSLSLIEAAMLAKPIIACAVGGNPEIIVDQKTGLLVQAQKPEELLRAMETLYSQRELAQKLGKQAYDLFTKQFRFETIVAEGFVPLYENH